MTTLWLRFEIGELDCAIPLDMVAEVTGADQPRLIPLVPRRCGGILNIRGEPLPVVDGGMLFCGEPRDGYQHVLVIESDLGRIGILVGHVSRLDQNVPAKPAEEELDPEGAPVYWVDHGGKKLGLVEPQALIERARTLLMGRDSQMGEGPCRNAY